eukprot:scaffold8088_cov189-Alexandrium_tamarense.AAC.3
MSNPHRNHRHYNSKEAIGKDAKGSTGEFPVGCGGSGVEGRRHDEFLHVAPREIRDLEAGEAKEEAQHLQVEIVGGVAGGRVVGGIVAALGYAEVTVGGVQHEGLHVAVGGRGGGVHCEAVVAAGGCDVLAARW